MALSFTKGVDIAPTETSVSNTKHHNLVDNATTNNDGDRTNTSQNTSLVHVASSAPTSNPVPINGHLWYDSTNDVLMEYDGTAWLPVARGGTVTNKSGGVLAQGDLVIVDTGNDVACTTSTTASNTNILGVVHVGGANDATVVVLTEGRAPVVNVDGATSIGDYLFHAGTAKNATPSSSNAIGSFARALTSTVGSGTVVAQLGGSIFAGGHSFAWTDTNGTTFTRALNAGSGSVNYAHGLSVTPWLITFTFATSSGRPHYGYGMCVLDASGNIHQTYSSQVHDSSTDKGKAVEGACIWGGEGTSATLSMQGAVSAVDGTNVTITWTQTGSTTAININVSAVFYG